MSIRGTSIHRKLSRAACLRPATAFILLLTMLTIGCSTSPEVPQTLASGDQPVVLAMIAMEPNRDQTHFYVKYEQGGKVSYSGGFWRDRIKLIDESEAQGDGFANLSIIELEYKTSTPWELLPKDAFSLKIFSAAQWRELRRGLLELILPTDGTSGLAVDFMHASYFLYFDAGGELHATLLKEKPPEYEVHEELRFDEFMSRGRPLLEAFLAKQGITDQEFVFNTGDAGLYSLPFLYINLETGVLAFARNVPLTPMARVEIPGMQTTRAFGHMMRSHLTSLVQRPVSSLYRLFFVVTDTATGTTGMSWATALSDEPVPPLSDAPPMDLESWEQELDDIATQPRSSGTVDVLVDGEAFFPRFIDSVNSASESVEVQTYIFDNDDFALQIGDMLRRRSNEDIEVNVLLDGLGTIGAGMIESESLPEYHDPPDSVAAYLEQDSQVVVRVKPNPWFTGDHVKSMIIDRELAYIGGMNIGREYRYDWHDLMIEIQGPVVDIISREFDSGWAHAGLLGDLAYVASRLKPLPEQPVDEGMPLRVLLTAPGNYEIFNAQREAIRRAQSYIYIQNAYFTDDQLLHELVKARRRGVDVRIVLPLETDHGPISRSNVLAVNVMLEHGIRVYLYPGFSHVKAAIYDGWVCVGSANFDRLSFKLNRELNIASSDPGFAAQMHERLFAPDFAVSVELTEQIPERWVDHLLELVGDYLY